MLPKNKRLNLSKDYRFVSSGKRLETTNFKITFRFGSNTLPLIGIALSGKYFNKATLRNKAKRATSEAIEALYSSLPKGLNLVIMPKGSILKEGKENLIKELSDVKNLFISN